MRRIGATYRFKFEVPITAVTTGTNSFSAGATASGFDDVIFFSFPVGASVSYASYAWAFQLADLNLSQQTFIQSFDRYLLAPIVMHVYPSANVGLMAPQGGSGAGSMAVQYCVMYDHDDFAAPGNTVAVWNNFRSRTGAKQRRGTRACRYLIKPTHLGNITDTNLATVTTSRSMRATWVDSQFIHPLHFAAKLMVQAFNPSTVVVLWTAQIRCTYYVRAQTILV